MADLSNQAKASRQKIFLLNTAFWITLFAIAIWNNYQWALSIGREFSWDTILSWSVPYYLPMIIIGPAAYGLLTRWIELPYSRQVLFHLVPSILTGLVHQFCLNFFSALYNEVMFPNGLDSLSSKLSWRYESGAVFSSNGFVFYWLTVGAFCAIIIYHRYRLQQLSHLQLKSDLDAAKLQSLQMQLQPHFLFNSFNAISTMARKNQMEEVVETVAALGDLLRESLALRDVQMISLSTELRLTEKYLNVQKIRLHDRLTVSLDMQPEILSLHVPSLLFQPIVENAFKHGVEKTSDPVSLVISGRQVGSHVAFTFFNNGAMLPDNFDLEKDAGFGLTITLSRLQHLYGDEFMLTLSNDREQGGVVVELNLPIK